MLFASILNSSVMLVIICSRRLQQTTFSDAFFLGALRQYAPQSILNLVILTYHKKCKFYVFILKKLVFSIFVVLDVHAFERLLGPCMDILKRNIDEYEEQLVAVFGSKADIGDLR